MAVPAVLQGAHLLCPLGGVTGELQIVTSVKKVSDIVAVIAAASSGNRTRQPRGVGNGNYPITA
jgi:hypothetical protein